MAIRVISSKRSGAVMRVLVSLWLVALFAVGSGCEGSEPLDRSAVFAAKAESLGMVLHEDLPEAVAGTIRAMPGIAFRQGSSFPRVLAHDRALIFDWVWREDALDPPRTVEQTVFATRYKGARLPSFLIAEIGNASDEEVEFAGGAVRFTTPNQWIQRYVIAGRSKSLLRKLFPIELRSNWKIPSMMRIEANGEWAVAYYPGRSSNPETLEWEFGDIQAVLAPWSSN